MIQNIKINPNGYSNYYLYIFAFPHSLFAPLCYFFRRFFFSFTQFSFLIFYSLKYKMDISDSDCQYHQFLIIGAGISALQAGVILASHNRDFLILQATDKLGGRIGTQKLSEVVRQEMKDNKSIPQWLTSNKEVLDIPIQYGATWISLQHQYMLKIIKQFKIRVFPQYYDGLTIYGQGPGKYQQVRSLYDHYKQFQIQIQSLLEKIDGIKQQLRQIQENQLKNKDRLNKFIDFYDTLSVKDFIKGQLKNEHLANQILNQIQTLQCISGDKLSMMQLFDDDSSLEALRFYTGKVQNTIDGMRVENGMITIPEKMLQKMMKQIKSHRPHVEQKQVLMFNSPVYKINNDKENDIILHVKGTNKKYKSKHVFLSVPIAVISQIQITKISESKKMIFDNQETGQVNRVYFVFEEPFWRSKYSGYGSFNHNFPFNEITDISPANLACGVLAFVFVGDKYNRWTKQNPDLRKRIQFLKGIIADVFLKGNKSSPYLQSCFTYWRSYSQNPYIRAGYQATTKSEIWKKIKDKGEDYVQSYDKDENNLVFIGSQFAFQFSTYLEGAIRLARQKTYKLLGIPDPWRVSILQKSKL